MDNIQENNQEAMHQAMDNAQQNVEHAGEKVAEGSKDVMNAPYREGQKVLDEVSGKLDEAQLREQDVIVRAKDKLPNVTPTPPKFKTQVAAYEVKARLQWGEPALTIIDVRDREVFNEAHIMGAECMPLDSLQQIAEESLSRTRDLYIYGENSEQVSQAASILRQAGYQRVAEMQGGIDAWKRINGAMEGFGTNLVPSPGAYNVFSRLKEFAEEKARERELKRSPQK